MKRFLTACFVLLLVMSMNAFATDTRVLTLGENNNVLLDEANIWMYPSRINDYPNLAIGEFDDGDEFTRLGVHFKFNNDAPWVLGTYFEDLGAFYVDDLVGDFDMIDFSLMSNRRINLFYGRALNGTSFGLRASYFQSSETEEDATGEQKQGFSYMDFGVGLTADNGAWDVAAQVGFGNVTDEDFDGDPITDDDGLMDFSLMGRYFHQVNPNYTLVPHVGFMYAKRGLIEYDAAGDPTDTYNDKGMMFDLGCGLNYTPVTNVLAVADFGLAYGKATGEYVDDAAGTPAVEDDYSTFILPYFKLGLDADVFKWMDVRMGATSYWAKDVEDYASGTKYTYKYAENSTYLGFGFHWGRLHVDTYTDPEIFLDGFNFISGEGTEMNFQISAVYEMM